MDDTVRIESLESQVAGLRRANRFLILLPCLAVLLAFQSPSQTVRAQKIEVTDAEGRVRARIEPGKIALLNASGQEKATVTADANNGNMTLSGDGQKRVSMFMSDKIPLIVLYNTDGEPVASLPAAIKEGPLTP